MHELYWTPPKELARNRTEQELEEIQARIEDRGGSKKESVYDVIKREKKKLRLRNVMDQKANSVADLAAVLVEQEVISEEDPGEYELKEMRSILTLDARAQRGALEELDAEIERLEGKIRELEKEKEMPVTKGGEESRGHIRKMRTLRNQTRKKLRDAFSEKEAMEHALLMASMAVPREIEMETEDKAVENRSRPQRGAMGAVYDQAIETNENALSRCEYTRAGP